jgi:hypothetical protein
MDDYRILLNGTGKGYSVMLGDPPRTYNCEVRAREGSGMMAIFVEGVNGSFRTITEAVEAISKVSHQENPNG